MKILHCPTTVGGNPQGLAKAERELGHDSQSLTLSQTVFQYPVDQLVWQDKDNLLVREYKRWKVIFHALRSYDVLHFNYGSSLAPRKVRQELTGYRKVLKAVYQAVYGGPLSFLDLKIAKRKGIVTAVTYQGSDARQGEYYPIHFCHNPGKAHYTPEGDKIKRAQIETVDHYADLIYALNPDLLNVLPARAKFIPYASVDPKEWKPKPLPKAPNAVPHIVHAPSNRDIKGTEYVLSAFERLKKEGVPFRYTLVEGMTNQKAREIYETADLLVDQLLIGYYGGLAVELMALAKPVICYIREKDLQHMPQEMVRDMPIINATPNTIYEVLKACLTTDKAELRDIGLSSRNYVETYHDPIKIAAKLVSDYKAIQIQRKIRF
jgi:glycosyltransferase involved in cell wall biosynthesis